MFGGRRRKREEATALVMQVTEDFLRERELEREVTLDSPLSERGLGLDSIARMELMGELERRGGLTIPERYWEATDTLTVGGLVDLVAKRARR